MCVCVHYMHVQSWLIMYISFISFIMFYSTSLIISYHWVPHCSTETAALASKPWVSDAIVRQTYDVLRGFQIMSREIGVAMQKCPSHFVCWFHVFWCILSFCSEALICPPLSFACRIFVSSDSLLVHCFSLLWWLLRIVVDNDLLHS